MQKKEKNEKRKCGDCRAGAEAAVTSATHIACTHSLSLCRSTAFAQFVTEQSRS